MGKVIYAETSPKIKTFVSNSAALLDEKVNAWFEENDKKLYFFEIYPSSGGSGLKDAIFTLPIYYRETLDA